MIVLGEWTRVEVKNTEKFRGMILHFSGWAPPFFAIAGVDPQDIGVLINLSPDAEPQMLRYQQRNVASVLQASGVVCPDEGWDYHPAVYPLAAAEHGQPLDSVRFRKALEAAILTRSCWLMGTERTTKSPPTTTYVSWTPITVDEVKKQFKARGI